jgi:hypothetical protein
MVKNGVVQLLLLLLPPLDPYALTDSCHTGRLMPAVSGKTHTHALMASARLMGTHSAPVRPFHSRAMATT